MFYWVLYAPLHFPALLYEICLDSKSGLFREFRLCIFKVTAVLSMLVVDIAYELVKRLLITG